MFLIFGIRKTKIICHFGLFFLNFLWNMGGADKKKKSLELAKCWLHVRPHTVTLVCQAGEVRLPGASLAAAASCLTSWMVSGKSEKQAKILCNLCWRDGVILQQLPLSSVKHIDGRISKVGGSYGFLEQKYSAVTLKP